MINTLLFSVCQNGTLFHEDTDTSVPRPTPSPTLSDTNSSSSQEGQSEPTLSSYQQRKDQAKKSRSGTSRRVSEPVNKRGSPSPSMVPNGHRSRGGKRSPQPIVSKSHPHKRATSPKTQSGVYSPMTTRGPNQALPERAYSSSPQLVRKLFNENPPVPVSSSSQVLQTLFANASTSTSSQVPSETLPLQALSLEDIEHQMKSEVPSPIDNKGHSFPLNSSVASNMTNPFLLQPSVFSSNSSGENIAPNGQLIPNQLLLQPSVTTQIQLSVQPPTPHSHTTSSGPIPIPSTHIPHAPKFPSIPSLVHSPGMRAPPISHPTHNHTPQTTVSTKSNTAVIASPAHFETPPKPNVERPVRTSPVPVMSTSSKAGLISPMQFSSVPQKSLSEPATTRVDLIKEEEGEESPSNIGLTKQQLQQALLYLIKVFDHPFIHSTIYSFIYLFYYRMILVSLTHFMTHISKVLLGCHSNHKYHFYTPSSTGHYLYHLKNL